MAAPINPKGGKPDKIWRNALMRALHRPADREGNPQYLDLLADKVVQLALNGDVDAIKEIGNRLDGRPTIETVQLPLSYAIPARKPFP